MSVELGVAVTAVSGIIGWLAFEVRGLAKSVTDLRVDLASNYVTKADCLVNRAKENSHA